MLFTRDGGEAALIPASEHAAEMIKQFVYYTTSWFISENSIDIDLVSLAANVYSAPA